MASEILGLFGGKTPQQLQQDYLSGMMVSPAQMGSQGLLQQLISTGANAGAMMGYGAGRLLGGKVSGEVEAAYLDEAIKAGQAGKTPAEKMKLVAASLEDKPGMGKQYMMALAEARRLEAEDFTMAQAKEKAKLRSVKRQVDTIDPYTGRITGQRTAEITQYDTGEKDEKGNIIWADLDGQDGSTKAATDESTKTKTPQQLAQEQLDKLNANKPSAGGSPTIGQGDAPSPEFTGRAGMDARLGQQNQQRAAEAQAKKETDYETEKLLRRSTPSFKSLAEKEAALRAAVKAGNYGLASQINKQPPFRKY